MLYVILLGVSVVVEEDAPPAEAVGAPVVDGVFEVGGGTVDVVGVGVVVECLGWLVGDLGAGRLEDGVEEGCKGMALGIIASFTKA